MRPFIWAFAGCLVSVACATIEFPFAFYSPNLANWDGIMVASKAAKDIDAASLCKPDASKKIKCVVMTTESFFDLKAEYLNCRMELSTLQRQR